jgi:hypothetical protein
MEVRERVIKIKEFVAKDGTVFSPINMKDEDVSSYETRSKESCEFHEEKIDDYYDFKNFEVDEKLLENWDPKNWEHFKWHLFRNYFKSRDDLSSCSHFYGVEKEHFKPIDSADKLIKLIKKVTYEKDEEDRRSNSHGYKTTALPWLDRDPRGFGGDDYYDFDTVGYLKTVVGSGIIKASRFSKNVFYNLSRKGDVAGMRYLIEQGLKPNASDVANIIGSDLYVRFKENPHFGREKDAKMYGTEEEILIDDNDDSFHFRYHMSDSKKEFVEFLLDNFKGDYYDVLIDLFLATGDRIDVYPDAWGISAVLQEGAKRNGVDNAFTRMDIISFLRLLIAWKKNRTTIEKIDDVYSIKCGRDNHVPIGEFEQEIIEKFFMKIYCNSRSEYDKRISTLSNMILEKTDINPRKVYFWILDHSWRLKETLEGNVAEEVKKLKEQLQSRADYFDYGGGNVENMKVDGKNIEVIWSTYECPREMSKENFYKSYPGTVVFDNRFEKSTIVDVKRRKINVDKPTVEKGEEIKITRTHTSYGEETPKVNYEYFFND